MHEEDQDCPLFYRLSCYKKNLGGYLHNKRESPCAKSYRVLALKYLIGTGKSKHFQIANVVESKEANSPNSTPLVSRLILPRNKSIKVFLHEFRGSSLVAGDKTPVRFSWNEAAHDSLFPQPLYALALAGTCDR